MSGGVFAIATQGLLHGLLEKSAFQRAAGIGQCAYATVIERPAARRHGGQVPLA
jgi:hypothetical protein